MRVRVGLRLCLVLLCTMVLASLGVTEFDPHPESRRIASVEDHVHDSEAQGHCHPGIDCAPAVIFLALHMPEVTPVRLDTPRLSEARLDEGWRFTDDPPPPRYRV
ncbi:MULTISPECIES: hypothetical protein [Rhodobacterales]|jgi:hypothetical protein|uniref:Cobalt transporter subunit CbtB n=2 Tax=Roseobacteraceae TaxID=2854170 RepID=A0A2T0WCJ6_9RHOB|nr:MULTISPECIES: hypothetical protein [Roseobacteraceae]MEC8669423.1 hypothetical protein [Pseudomonadota bacterium]MEE3070252.1 hypothetical protein [Pseudomonadota bacterium]PRY84427.1 hypothetical protein CLV74_12424 [Donghicola tyrosinivorans]CUH81893.1 hypothetical protein TRN7648_03697 [Tropicibacter naphthalenivorans]SMD02278.1 hypothetical protein SAMN04488093_110115 [Tropicibacter naphthalenivorans]